MKYELTNETIEVSDHVLYRIKALRSFNNVNAGDLGGFVESTNNLSQAEDDSAWVFDNAAVYGSARVFGRAQIFENARVFARAQVSGNAQVYGNAAVYGDAAVYGNARVFDRALVSRAARVYGDVWVYGNALVFDSTLETGFHTGTAGSAPSTNAVVNSNISDFAKMVSDFSKSAR